MVGDSKINTQVDLKSYVEDSSINDSVFISSSISLDVVIGIGVIFAIILTVLLFLRIAKKDQTFGTRSSDYFKTPQKEQ